MTPTGQFHLVTLGCPKNEVDSDKLAGTLVADGMVPTDQVEDAELIVVNTCAFVEDARRESIDTVLALADERQAGARLVVTGCMAERYGTELADELPEVDQVVGFGVPVLMGKTRANGTLPPAMDLLNLPRPASTRPWAYVKAAEGCDRACGYCAIPSFRGPQRSRSAESILAEVDGLGVREVVLVAQDLAAYGRDQGVGEKAVVALLGAVADRVDWVRLLYLYPSEVTDPLVDAVCASGVPYFDLSLQHVSRPLLRRMRRWGDGDRFSALMKRIRRREPNATFRSNFIVGYPGRPKRITMNYSPSWPTSAWTGAGSSRSAKRSEHTPRGSTAPCQHRWLPSASGNWGNFKTPSPPRSGMRSSAARSRCSSTSRAGGAPTARPPRSTAWWRCPPTCR